MAINIGDVVWMNSGQGPWTIVDVQGDSGVCSQGNNAALNTIPLVCLSTTNPNPMLDYNRQAATNNYSKLLLAST